MKIYHSLSEFIPLSHAVVTSGTFDGVHIGHQKIIHRLNELATSRGGESVVLTFWPHPRLVVAKSPDLPVQLLTTIDEKAEILAGLGVQHLLVLPFTRDFSELTAERYVQDILLNGIGTKTLIIGYDHRFGKNRSGGFDFLQSNKDRFNLEIEEISRQEIDNSAISSTKIREALVNGNLDVANGLLGRPYSFVGVVVKGRQLGRTIGFPTANIYVSESYKLIPLNGVYAVRVSCRNKTFLGVMNIGNRPTVDGVGRTNEVHIIDFNEDIYGEILTVHLHCFIRPETKFSSLDELKKQIHLDRQNALDRLMK